MPDDKVAHPRHQYLNGPAAQELESCVDRFQDDLLSEASRLEAASRSGSGNPELTSTMILDADLLLRRAYRRAPQNRWMVGAKIGSVIGSFLTGMLADFEKLARPDLLVLFILLLSVTIALAVVVAIKE